MKFIEVTEEGLKRLIPISNIYMVLENEGGTTEIDFLPLVGRRKGFVGHSINVSESYEEIKAQIFPAVKSEDSSLN